MNVKIMWVLTTLNYIYYKSDKILSFANALLERYTGTL